MKRSSRGSRERVEAARREAALALGRDPDQRDSFVEPKASSSPSPSQSVTSSVPSRGIGVLTVGEAAARLGMGRTQLDAMVARGQVETLPIEFGCVIPTREVERLQRPRCSMGYPYRAGMPDSG